MQRKRVDFVWGNHDVLWMGAAMGNPACIANALRNSLKYGNFDTLEDGYGINVRPLALFAMAVVREVFGSGSFAGIPIPWLSDNPISVLTMAPGGFAVFGLMIALVNKFSKGKAIKKTEFGCENCPSAAACGKASCIRKEESQA